MPQSSFLNRDDDSALTVVFALDEFGGEETPVAESNPGEKDKDKDKCNVQFVVINWDARVADPATVTYEQPTSTTITAPVAGSQVHIFEVVAAVKIVNTTQVSPEEANQCCSKWSLTLIQNVVGYGPVFDSYLHSHWPWFINAVPSYDKGFAEREGAVKQFSRNNEVLVIRNWDDVQRAGNPLWDPPPPGKENPLTVFARSVKFTTWLVAYRPDEKEEDVYLRWVDWEVAWVLNTVVNATGLVSATYSVRIFRFTNGGVGMGPVAPVFDPNSRNQGIRIPPYPSP